MRLQALPTLTLLAAAALLAGQSITPFNVQTGQWQVTEQLNMTGTGGGQPIPPDVAAHMTPQMMAQFSQSLLGPKTLTWTTCVTPATLTQNPFPSHRAAEDSCTSSVLNSTGTDLTVKITCTGDITGGGQVVLHAVDSQHVTGSGNGSITSNGNTIQYQVNYTGKLLGSTCPKGSQ